MEMKLTLQKTFTKKEMEILRIMRAILEKTEDDSIYLPLNTIQEKKLSVVLHHFLFGSRDFLGSIFTLLHDSGYHAAYVVGSALVEYFIDFSFVLKVPAQRKARANEYHKALQRKNSNPFSKHKKYKFISERAKVAELSNLYNKTYRSLCSFKHGNLKGHIVTRRDARLHKDRPAFILQMSDLYLTMWHKLTDSLGVTPSKHIEELLAKEFLKLEHLIKKELDL